MPASHAYRQRHELQRRIAAWLDVPLAVLALVMAILLILDLTNILTPAWERRVSAAETGIWAIFVADFVLEFTLAPSKLRYLRKNWLTVISIVLPAFRVVRILRLAGLLRGVSLVRILTTVNRSTRALAHVTRRGQLGYVLLLTIIVTSVAAAGAFYFERGVRGASIRTIGDALWWAATLVTTINVSIEATTIEGRIIGLLLRVFALGIAGYLTAVIATYLIGQQQGNRPPPRNSVPLEELRALQREVQLLRQAVERERAPAPIAREGAGAPPGEGQ